MPAEPSLHRRASGHWPACNSRQAAAPCGLQALDLLINDLTGALDDETILVLDDYQLVDDIPTIRALIERLMLYGSPLLHVLIATRGWPQLRCIPTLQARDELLVIGEHDLAFTTTEIAELAESLYNHTLSPAEVQRLHEQTGGWPIAVPLMWQHVQQRASADGQPTGTIYSVSTDDHSVPSALSLLPASPPNDVLFAYLAQEALAGQPDDIQAFLLCSSVLAELDPAACDYVLGGTGSSALLRTIERRGTFLVAIGDERYRYHPLFQSFLQQRARATLPDWLTLHQRAAAYYRAIGAHENVLYHLMAAGDSDHAAQELEDLAPAWLASGRFTPCCTGSTSCPRPRSPRMRSCTSSVVTRRACSRASIRRCVPTPKPSDLCRSAPMRSGNRGRCKGRRRSILIRSSRRRRPHCCGGRTGCCHPICARHARRCSA